MHHLLLIKLLRKHFSTEDNIIVGVPAEEGGGVVIVGVAVRLRAVRLKDLQRFLKFLFYLKLVVLNKCWGLLILVPGQIKSNQIVFDFFNI